MIGEEEIAAAASTLADTAASPATVIVFGSHAGGTARAGSDVDFLVVEDELPAQIKEYGRLRRAIRSLDAPVDILVVARDHADAWKDVRGSVIHEAFTKGKVLVER